MHEGNKSFTVINICILCDPVARISTLFCSCLFTFDAIVSHGSKRPFLLQNPYYVIGCMKQHQHYHCLLTKLILSFIAKSALMHNLWNVALLRSVPFQLNPENLDLLSGKVIGAGTD